MDSRHRPIFQSRERPKAVEGEADSSGTFPFSDADCELLHHPRPSFSVFRPAFHAHSSGTPRHVEWLGPDLRRNTMSKPHHAIQAHPSPPSSFSRPSNSKAHRFFRWRHLLRPPKKNVSTQSRSLLFSYSPSRNPLLSKASARSSRRRQALRYASLLLFLEVLS